jgi:hypothetical protein
MKDFSMYKYFKGEKENPFKNGTDNGKAMIWFYESKWYEMHESNDKILDWHLSEYTSTLGLVSFEHFDGTPITLKALLFNRFSKGYNARIFAVDDFKKWYLESYKATYS